MASEKYILVRPPQLPELANIQAGAYVVGYNTATDQTVKINVSTLGGGQETDINWRADTEYSEDNIVEFGLRLWKSLVNDNVGNIPLEGTNWTEVSKAGAGSNITNYTTGVYTYDPTIVLREGRIYYLLAEKPFESTNFIAELEANQWREINRNNIIGVAYNNLIGSDYYFPNLDDTLIVLTAGTIGIENGIESVLSLTITEPSYVIRTGTGYTAGDFTILPIGGGGGHVFENQSGTALPTRNVAKAGAGVEFEDDPDNEKTVVRVDEDLTDHIDGADEEKHTANQIHGGIADDNKIYYVDPTTKKLTPSNFTVDQILQLSSIDVTEPDWQVGEQRLVTVEKTIDEEPSLKGATQLVDLVLPLATVTTLENATGWVGETRTLTGANFFGEIGRIGQRGTGADGTIYICTAASAGTQGSTNGSATFVRNRSVDALDPDNNTNDNNIANLLDPTRVGGNADANWDVVNNVLIISTLVCRVGTWFTSGTGYFFMCYERLGNSYYWRRIGQPQAIQRPINATNYPTLTSNLLAHDFTAEAYQNQSGDETNYQDQTFYDATTRRLFWQVKTGVWEEITINK